ncbi:MAG: hemolysin family protein [Planctomycetota bacterium]
MDDPLADPGTGTWVSSWYLGIAALLTGIVSALFTYFYFLLLNFSRTRLLQLCNGTSKREKIEKHLDGLNRIFNTVVVLEITCKTLFVLCLHIFFTRTMGTTLFQGMLPTLIVSAVWFIFFCRILTTEIGTHREEEVLLHVLPVLNMISYLLSPFLAPLNMFRRFVRKMIKASTPAEEAEHFAEDIMDAVEEGEREGVIQEQEADMIEGVMEIYNSEVSEIMTPRPDMLCFEIRTPITKILKKAMEIGHSRLPIFEETRDRIIGILYVKDLLAFMSGDKDALPPLKEILRKPFFIPETKRVSELLYEFRDYKTHMAIVLDEYGGTAGLVTNEDILEEIVGEIVDEYDHDEEQEIKLLGNGKAEVSARLHIDELNETMNIDLPESDDFDTIGGYVFTRLGKVPSKGDEVQYKNIHLTVMDAGLRRVKRILIEVTEAEEDPPG